MSTIFKAVLGLIGLITLAMVFPLTRQVYDVAEDNGTGPGTGILYFIGGIPTGGTTTNNAFLAFLPIGIPVMLFIVIIIYVVKGRSKGEGGAQ